MILYGIPSISLLLGMHPVIAWRCVRVRVRACVRACVRVSVCVREYISVYRVGVGGVGSAGRLNALNALEEPGPVCSILPPTAS